MDPSQPGPDPPAWTDIQDILLLGLKEKSKTWREIAAAIEGCDTEDCRERYDALVEAKAAAEEAVRKEAEEAASKVAAEEVAAKEAEEVATKTATEEGEVQKRKEAEEAAKKKAEETKEVGGKDKTDAGEKKDARKGKKKNKGKGNAKNSLGDPPTDAAADASLNHLSMQDVRPFFPFIFQNLNEFEQRRN